MQDIYTINKIEYTRKEILSLVQSPSSTSETLEHLARDTKIDETIKTFIARHPNTHSKTLVYLLKYDKVEMMGAIAEHSNTAPEILELMVRSSDKLYTQYRLAQNSNTPTDALEELCDETDSSEVKLAIAQNPNTSLLCLKSLFDENELISIEAKKNYAYQEHNG